VRAALERLAAADREVLVLRFFEQLSTRELAGVLGVSEAAAKSSRVVESTTAKHRRPGSDTTETLLACW
jgi:DNA-directed RNA polymerase specialized sigma24 family protein